MKSLKSVARSYLRWLAVVMMVVLLILAVVFQAILMQGQARENAEATFVQMEQLLQENGAELVILEEEYKETCLLNAEVIAYIIQHHPGLLGDVEEFRQLARKMQVDEIHIFDDTGCIFTGTHPEYYNYTFDTGEQIGFFKPMMEDKSLRLCQDITPNTAEGKLVQYSALWSSDGKFIVQVGMYPEAVLKATQKNELSYIFSLLQGNPGVRLLAVDPQAGMIIGSTHDSDNGKNIAELGLELSEMDRFQRGAHAMVGGINSYCIFQEMEDVLIGYTISEDQLYGNIGFYTLLIAFCLLIIELFLVYMVQNFSERYIAGSISLTNEKLRAVTDGKLDERVDVQSSQEFAELSSHINRMIQSLLATTDKMSFVLDRTDMRIGVYEYSTKMKTVRFTQRIPDIFRLNHIEASALSADNSRWKDYIDQLRIRPVPERESTYCLEGKEEIYIRLEEVTRDNDVLGIAMDVTEEISSLKRAEKERDIDLLTGLYNRRGMERRFDELFAAHDSMKCGALVVIDSDNLKVINDTYGHGIGDIYLRSLADILRDFDAPQYLAARVGGDEFVLLIYGYERDEDVLEALECLRHRQDTVMISLADGMQLGLQFSYGYELTHGRADYDVLFSTADGHMYCSKRIRKEAR